MSKTTRKLTVAQIKAAVRARDGFRCSKCQMTNAEHLEEYGKALDVHRIVPGSKYTVEGCLTLCRKCHGPQPRRTRGTSGRLLVEIPDLHRAALTVTAIKEGVSVTELLVRLIEESIGDEIKRLADYRAQQGLKSSEV